MIIEVKDFKRKEIFENFDKCSNPFITLTTKIDVTKVVEHCKKTKKFYATFGYIITKTVNQIDNFKYRCKDNKIYYCDEIRSNYTQRYTESDTIGFYDVPVESDLKKYIYEYKKIENEFFSGNNNLSDKKIDKIWLSCQPWFKFESFIPIFDKKCSIPQFIWDRYENVGDKYYINLMISVHHGFVDGFHIAKFIELLNRNIENIIDNVN